MKFYTELWSKKVDYYTFGTKLILDWSIDGNRLCLRGDIPNTEICFKYEFSDSNTLQLDMLGIGTPITLVKQ